MRFRASPLVVAVALGLLGPAAFSDEPSPGTDDGDVEAAPDLSAAPPPADSGMTDTDGPAASDGVDEA
jgi:hypothetical protein